MSELRAFENDTRAKLDFAYARPSETALGPDPYVVHAAPWEAPAAPQHFVGLLRGRSALVELDGSLHELARLPAPESPTGLAVGADGAMFVVGELSNRVARYAHRGGRLEPDGFIELPGVLAARDVATGPEGVLYVVEEHDGRLLTFAPPPESESTARARSDIPLCRGPIHVRRVGPSVLVDCLVDHAIVVLPVDAHGYPSQAGELRVTHDGPMWGFDAIQDGGSIVLAVGGVEDHPLDRTGGSFGFVDSFATVYRIAGTTVAKVREENMSAVGLVTPKAIGLSRGPSGHVELTVAAYGSDRFARFEATGAGPIATSRLPPGTAMLEELPDASFVAANPLLDAWVRVAPEGNTVVGVDDDESSSRSDDSRLGEELFFTNLMAPWNLSDGPLSRFTCETCHFEGYVDGRTHRTGRGDVRATTKPLLGLFNNRPHFSRALDPDMATMVNNEFRVAGAKSGHSPWFSLSKSELWWDAKLVSRPLGPEALRRALMSFFMDFTHRPNPAVVGRTSWGSAERAGAEVFRDKCESCHQARLVTDTPSSRVAFGDWERLVMSREGGIVWAESDYAKTGVVPYVNEAGARVVSLRRLYKKYPYFTNGSAKSIGDVLDRAGFAQGAFFHDGAPEGATRLTGDEKVQLSAFLDLL